MVYFQWGLLASTLDIDGIMVVSLVVEFKPSIAQVPVHVW